MRRVRWVLVGLATSAIGACQLFGGLGGLEFKGKSSSGLAGGGGSSESGGSGQGAGAFGGNGTGGIGTTSGSSSGPSTTSSSSSSGGGLDPNLALPDPGGTPCTDYGTENGCMGSEVCRIASTHGGRCEGCSECGNLNATCTTGEDCDILFECYKNHCTNFCMLGTTECGPPQDCIDVGNPGSGVCWPVP